MSLNVGTTLVPSASVTTSVTQEEPEKTEFIESDRNPAGKVAETSSSLEDDWENDPANPRNWSIGKKWVVTAIVNAMTSYILLLRLI